MQLVYDCEHFTEGECVFSETHDSPRTQLITLMFYYVLKYNKLKKN